jgi:hypothetical protein
MPVEWRIRENGEFMRGFGPMADARQHARADSHFRRSVLPSVESFHGALVVTELECAFVA